MKESVNLLSLKINSQDPRDGHIFQSLNSAFTQSNNKKKVPNNWENLEQLCFQQFLQHGYDLQTGVWFCLVNSHLKGWGGMLQALELFTGAWRDYSGRCWPPENSVTLRQSILNWLTQHVATLIYTMPMPASDIAIIQRVEDEIRKLCEHVRVLEARCADSLENVRYFLQVRTHSLGFSPAYFRKTPALLQIADPSVVSERKPLSVSTPKKKEQEIKFLHREQSVALLLGIALGSILTLVVGWGGSTVNENNRGHAMTLPISLLQSSAQSIEEEYSGDFEEIDGIIPKMREQLLWLAGKPPQQWIMQGEELAHRLEQASPDNIASFAWRQRMQEKAGSLKGINSWHLGMEGLSNLEQRLQQSEKDNSRYMTVSELKTAVYQIKQHFQQQGKPLGEQLSNLEIEMLNKNSINPAILYQIQEEIDSALAKYTIIKSEINRKNTSLQ